MDGSTAHNTVFIDTSLSTHLALIVSDVDTVSDLKKKIMYEHPLCFPNFGEIEIHALKVKRKGYFYHLTDHMFVKSAFDGVKKNWFLSIDASSLIKHDKSKLSSDPGSSNALVCITNSPLADGVDVLHNGTSKKLSITDNSKLQGFEGDHFLNQVPMADHFGPEASIREVLKDLEMEVKHVSGDHCKTSSSDSSQKLDSGIQEKCDQFSKRNKMLGIVTECKKDKSSNEISDLQCNVPLEENLQSGTVSKKKSKSKRKFEALMESCALKVNDGSVDASSKDILEQEITVLHNADNACKGILDDTGMGNKHISDESGQNLSSDWARTQVTGTHAERDDDRFKEKVVGVQPNVSLEEASEAGLPAKKKRKIEKQSKSPLNEKEVVDVQPNVSLGEASEAGAATAAKKKRKIEKNSKDPLNEKEALICNSSQETSKPEKKSKKKPSSSYIDVVAAVPFSMEEVREEISKGTLGMSQKGSGKEPDEAIVHVQSVQDAMRSEPCSISLREKDVITVQEVGAMREVLSHDIDTSEVDADKTGKERVSSQNNDPNVLLPEKSKPSDQNETEMSMKEVVVSRELLDGNGVVESGKSAGRGKKPKKSKKTDGGVTSGIEHAHSFVSGITSSEPLKAMDNVKKGENVRSQTATAEVAETETVKFLNFGADEEAHVMLPEKSKPSDQGETEMSMKEVVVSQELLDGNGAVEPRKSFRRRKKPKKTKNTDGGMQVTPGIKHALSFVSGTTSTEPLETVNLNMGADEEAHEVHGNVEESAQPMQAGKTEEIPVKRDVKGKKKSRSKMSSTVENLPDEIMKEQDVGHLTPLIEKTNEADVPSEKKNKPNLMETGSENPINGSNLQSQKDTGNKSESLQCQAGVDVDFTCGRTDETIKKIGDSVSQDDIIKFSDYFLPSQQQHEVADSAEAFDDNVIDTKRSERKMEAKKNSDKVDRRSVGTSPDLQDPLRSNDNHGSETESGHGNSSTFQESLRKDKSDKLLPGFKKKSSKVSENKVEAQRSASKPNIVKASVTTTPARASVKKNKKVSAALSSSSEISFHKGKSQSNKKRMTAGKASVDNSRKNIPNRGKSLLAISGSIFKDGDGDSSEDDGLVDSDASTRTPSDDSSSSDYSEVENKAGSHGAKRNAGGDSSGLKNMTLDAILKSSSRFKKAKITASQYEEDTESQPIDFVPDSQANL